MASKDDYIPSNEEDFNDFQGNFTPKVVAKAVVWGIPDVERDALTDAHGDWDPKYAAGKDEADPTAAQRQAKNDSRKAYTVVIRNLVNTRIRNNAAVTNDDKVSLQLTVPDGTRTRVPVPDHAPKIAIDKIEHELHKLRITDPEKPTTKAKPDGVARINVYRFVGTTAPTNISQYQLYGSATKALFTSQFGDEDVEKKAWYIAQYENTRGERGPVSTPVSAVIA